MCTVLSARVSECKQRLSVAGVRETDMVGMDWEMVVDPRQSAVSASYEKMTRAYVGLDNICGWHVEESVSELQRLCQQGDMEAVSARVYADRGALTPGLLGLETGYNVLHFAVKHNAAELIERLTCTCICCLGHVRLFVCADCLQACGSLHALLSLMQFCFFISVFCDEVT